MEITRNKYLNDLVIRMNNKLIKIVTGIRRCGKSYLVFKIFKDYLIKSGIKENHIIEIELDLWENKKYREPDAILKFIHSKLLDNQTYYILLDEVQMLSNFEEVLNSLLHIENVDIYVTGSNSKFLSKDVVTEFRGRGDEIHIHPLTFKEFIEVYNGDIYHGWADYIVYGGLPLIATMKTIEQKNNYLKNLFTETYLKDIIERNHVDKKNELDDLVNILSSNIGSLTNANKIQSTFKSQLHSAISINTIKQYLDYLKDAFLINEAIRYDIKGRKYIGSPLKYYFEDVGLRNARIGFRQTEENHIMENIIYNELIYRGFNVDVGIVPIRENINGSLNRKQLEIDFVANKGNQRIYIQSAFLIQNEFKMKQEKHSLESVPDSFKKIIIVKDVMNLARDEKGIITINLFDFLLDENSLNL